MCSFWSNESIKVVDVNHWKVTKTIAGLELQLKSQTFKSFRLIKVSTNHSRSTAPPLKFTSLHNPTRKEFVCKQPKLEFSSSLKVVPVTHIIIH